MNIFVLNCIVKKIVGWRSLFVYILSGLQAVLIIKIPPTLRDESYVKIINSNYNIYGNIFVNLEELVDKT